MKKYLVGGAVRDRLLNLPINEKDWVVVGATPSMLLDKGFNQVGKDFPVFLHPKTKEEYALARTERKSGKGYTGFICDIDQSITLEQDLMRRDLTINAIAMDEEQQLIDPYHGIDDIEKRILRHVSAAFKEDPLRVLRVARFAARFHHLGFTIAPETLSLMKEIVADGEMALLTPERVWRETDKALSTDDPQVYFDVLKICGALVVLFPELDDLFHVTPVQPLSCSVSLGERALLALKQASRLTTESTTRFAILCHSLNVAQINQCCLRLKAPNEYKKIAAMVSQYHAQIERIEMMSAKEIVSLLNAIDVWRQPHNLQPLILCHLAKADEAQKESYQRQVIYLQQAYSIANSVSVQQIIAAGFIGEAIKHELMQLRIKVINEWKNVRI